MNHSDPQNLSLSSDLAVSSPSASQSSLDSNPTSKITKHHVSPQTHVKFRGDAVELRHKVKINLGAGKHQLLFENIADSVQELSFIVLEGAQHVICSVVNTQVEYGTADGDQERLAQTQKIHQLEHDLKEINRAVKKAQKGVQQALRLFKGWIPKAREEQVLELKEWNDGLALLEQTLLDRIKHQDELEIVQDKLQMRLDELNSKPNTQLKTIQVDIEVEQEERYCFELSYVLTAATWHPIFQARLSEEQFEPSGTKPKVEAKISLEMSARFLQATQESWVDCSAEFCLYPAPKIGFPTLNYPAYERLTIQSYQGGHSASDIQKGLHSPWAGLCHLFSDQVTLNLSLELDLSKKLAEVMVMGQGKLDTLLPLGGGIVHSFVGDEWIGQSHLKPLILGEQIDLCFGLYAPLEVFIERIKLESLDDLTTNLKQAPQQAEAGTVAKKEITAKTAIETASEPEVDQVYVESGHILEQSADTHTSKDLALIYERLNIAIKNTDPQVRTVLLCQPLMHGQLISIDEGRPQTSPPIGWVLSADRTRLMRWVSIAPQRTERLNLVRKCF